jgi:oligoendopeptidase F
MTSSTLLPRNQIAAKDTWNDTSVFPSKDAWETALKGVGSDLGSLAQYKGRLSEGASVLADAYEAIEALGIRAGAVMTYAVMAYATETTHQTAMKMYGQAQGLMGQYIGAISYLDPELLAIGRGTIDQWVASEPRLSTLAHYVDNLFRNQAHVRSAEVEELLGLLAEPFSGPGNIAGALTDSDFKFAPAITADGTPTTVAQGTLDRILSEPDREARKTAWESYADTYLAYKNTLATSLSASIKQNVFTTRARRYDSTLSAALFGSNLPREVYENLIGTFIKNLPVWHRYWEVRRKALGVETLHPYDIWAPLTPDTLKVSYAEGVEMICKGLALLGEDYVNAVRQGCLEDRWVDIYPNEGKMSGAFSSGSKGTHPFIMMSYVDDYGSMSTLAHELGHSMHSYLTNQNQPLIYTEYSMFAAETASNFNQAMVRAHLLSTDPDRQVQLTIIQEAMDNIHRYLFIMPTLARFELETHERIERGEGLTADDMNSLMADLFTEAYGPAMHVDRDRVGITWAEFGHLYVNYYVFQYATGISAAHALAKRILDGTPNAVEDYLKFLKAGGSMYPIDALKMAGIDMTQPDAVNAAFAILEGYVDRLEKLIS